MKGKTLPLVHTNDTDQEKSKPLKRGGKEEAEERTGSGNWVIEKAGDRKTRNCNVVVALLRVSVSPW
jgi:hypothetical protein